MLGFFKFTLTKLTGIRIASVVEAPDTSGAVARRSALDPNEIAAVTAGFAVHIHDGSHGARDNTGHSGRVVNVDRCCAPGYVCCIRDQSFSYIERSLRSIQQPTTSKIFVTTRMTKNFHWQAFMSSAYGRSSP